MSAAGVALPAGALLGGSNVLADDGRISQGDADILRWLAAAEIIESDLWLQYSELGGTQTKDGTPNTGNPAYKAALENLDGDMPQYIADNTDDEQSHAAFINAYLRSKGAQTVDLGRFATLSPSKATGADQTKKRITTLQSLNVDTSWWTRYRSIENPDSPFNDTFPQAINPPNGIQNQPAIPLNDTDTPPNQTNPVSDRMQAIANTAGFHFAFIEQGGSSLYPVMAQKASSLEVLRIIVSIGGTEIAHFQTWHDKAGNAPTVTDPVTGLHFDLGPFQGNEALQANLIMPEPCDFLSEAFPDVSIIRPTSDRLNGAVAALHGFTADGLFKGQSQAFFDTVERLAEAADRAHRQVIG